MSLKHFVRLAKRGKPNTGASGGELRARRLALAIVDNLPGLDDQAIAGSSNSYAEHSTGRSRLAI